MAISSPDGASGSAAFRMRVAGFAATSSTSAATFAAAVVCSTPRPLCASKMAGRRSRTRLTKIHSRGGRAPSPWIFDGRSIDTGRPLSSSTRSAATLLGPYPARLLKSMSPGSSVGCVSVTGSTKHGGSSEFECRPAAST